jgi:hypothetical protein
MRKKETITYSAAIVSKKFWLHEFEKYIDLTNQGNTKEQILLIQENTNYFNAPSADIGKKIISVSDKKLSSLPIEIKNNYSEYDISTKRIINFITYLNSDLLFFEYIATVYFEDVSTNATHFDKSSIKNFFDHKRATSEKIRGFSDAGIKRMSGAYLTYLKESGLVSNVDGELTYTKVIIDSFAKVELSNSKLNYILEKLKGVL